MSGKCSSIAPLTVAALLTISAPADAAPSWLHLVNLPLPSNEASTGEATTQAAPERSETATPEREETAAPERSETATPRTRAGLSHEELCETLVSSARERQLPVTFFTNLIWQESRFNPKTVSHAGAQGIAQFMPAVSKEVGLDNPFDPREAIPAAAQLLRSLVDKFGNVGLAAAAYNAGPGRVRVWMAKKGRLPAETRHYVSTITGRPADTWRGRKESAVAFAVPSSVPCHGVATFAAATRTEQAEAASMMAEEPAVTRETMVVITAHRAKLVTITRPTKVAAAVRPMKVAANSRQAKSSARAAAGAQDRRVAAAKARPAGKRGASTREAGLTSRGRKG